MADVGATTTSSKFAKIVMSASAKPSESARLSSTSLKKTNGKTAMDVSTFEASEAGASAWPPADAAASASSTLPGAFEAASAPRWRAHGPHSGLRRTAVDRREGWRAEYQRLTGEATDVAL